MAEPAVTGGCFCGAVRYEASQPPREVGYCHCSMCRRATGGPFALYAAFDKTAVRFTEEPPRFFASSRIAERGFCPRCGTPLTFGYFGSQVLHLTVGSLDDPAAARPTEHVGVEAQLPWLNIDDGLPRQPTSVDPERL